MKCKGRFLFDERPLKERELNRLVTLSEIYQPYTKGILLSIKDRINSKIRKVIDIGAGTGHTTLLLKELFPKAEVTYFDYSIDLLNYAKKIAKENNKAIEFKLGARGLRSIFEAIMIDAMFELPSKKQKTFKLTIEYAKKRIDKTNMKKLRVA